jgi:hypothetical protein
MERPDSFTNPKLEIRSPKQISNKENPNKNSLASEFRAFLNGKS